MNKELTANEFKNQIQILSSLLSRSILMSQIGQSYSGSRDLYTSLGYPITVGFEDMLNRYIRQDIAKRIVNAFPDACWSKEPEIEESEEEETSFEKAWKEFILKVPIWHYLKRIDRISGIGRYGVLLIGFDDGKKLDQPCTKASRVLFLRPFSEVNATIAEWESNINNERYGLPKYYTLSISQPTAIAGANLTKQQMKVHHTRVLHIADELTEDDVYGTPRLECVYNRLQDLEMIAGGGAEMWWRGAFPGFGFKAVDGATFNDADIPALEDEIEDYIHGLKRYMKLKNIDIQQLQPQMTDSTKPFEVEITLISVATGIPKRILMGTERGELASSQDTSEWDDRTEERRANYCIPRIIRPFIDKLIAVKVLPQPTSYSVYWSPVHIMNEKERAEISVKKSDAIIKYAGTVGANEVVDQETFLDEVMGFEDDQIELIMKRTEETKKKNEEKKREDQQMAHENTIAIEQTKAKNRAGGNVPLTQK